MENRFVPLLQTGLMYEILSVFVQCNCVHVIFGFLNYLPGSSWMHGVLIIWRGALSDWVHMLLCLDFLCFALFYYFMAVEIGQHVMETGDMFIFVVISTLLIANFYTEFSYAMHNIRRK